MLQDEGTQASDLQPPWKQLSPVPLLGSRSREFRWPWLCRRTSPFCSVSLDWLVRLGLASRRPDLVVVLAGRSSHCTYSYSLLWLWVEPLLHLSAVEFFRCLHVERQHFALAQRSFVPVCPIWRAHRHGLQRSQHRCSRPPLQRWAPVLPRQLRCRNVHHTDAPLNQLVGRTRTLKPDAGSGQRLSLQELPAASPKLHAALWFLDFSSSLQPVLLVVVALGFQKATSPSPSSTAAPLASRACPLHCCRARASGGSADAPSRTCANKRKSLRAEDNFPDSIGDNVAATRALPFAKASTQPASSLVVSPAGGGQADSCVKRCRQARRSLMRASLDPRLRLERSFWKDI